MFIEGKIGNKYKILEMWCYLLSINELGYCELKLVVK